jgi:Fur family transcriptional regulator, ferric uptake regulator
MTTRLENILKVNQLSVTDNRKMILELFLGSAGALSHNDIEKKVGQKFDRVTIYRTLQIFLEKGIIHNIPSADNSIHYALCRDNCSAGDHRDNHIHFVCNVCSNTICLEDVSIPAVRLPKGFTSKRIEMLVSGVCKNCK